MKKTIFLVPFLFTMGLFAEVKHTGSGAEFGKEGAELYALHRHGQDGALFLDPFLSNALKDVEGKKILDAGCGAAPWGIYAAAHGAHVCGIDSNKEMLILAEKAVREAHLQDKVELTQGDVALLPYEDGSFDMALSVLVGCCLPSTAIAFTSEGERYEVGLGAHINEMARVLKPGGTCIVVGPASFGTVFSDGACDEDIAIHLSDTLLSISPHAASEEIAAKLGELTEIHRATFAKKGKYIHLIRDEGALKDGQEIWRKTPGMVVPNRYHSELEYLLCFKEAGLKIDRFVQACFSTEEEWEKYLAENPTVLLGDEYVSNPPFVLFFLRKI